MPLRQACGVRSAYSCVLYWEVGESYSLDGNSVVCIGQSITESTRKITKVNECISKIYCTSPPNVMFWLSFVFDIFILHQRVFELAC